MSKYRFLDNVEYFCFRGRIETRRKRLAIYRGLEEDVPVEKRLALGAFLVLIGLTACGSQTAVQSPATVTVTATASSTPPASPSVRTPPAEAQAAGDTVYQKDRAFLQEARLNGPLLSKMSDSELVTVAGVTCYKLDNGSTPYDVVAWMRQAQSKTGATPELQLQYAQMIGAGIRAYCPWNEQRIQDAAKAPSR